MEFRSILQQNRGPVPLTPTLGGVKFDNSALGQSSHNARLLRDQAGSNLHITTNSITLGGGESLDVILDSTNVPPGTYFLYTRTLTIP